MKLQPKKSKTNTHVELPAKVKLAPLKKAEAPKSTPTCAPPVESCNSSDILYQVKSYLNSLGGAEVLHTLNSITGGGVFNPELTIQLVNDEADPGNNMYYGTDNSGEKGFHSLGTLSDLHYTHDQSVASSMWVIDHNLGKYPSTTIVDSAGSVFFGEISYPSLNTITITFSASFSGKAFLN